MVGQIATGLTDAVESLTSDVTAVVATIAPGILALMGSVAAVILGFKLFKKFTNKAG